MVRGFSSYCDEFGHPRDPRKKFVGIAGLLAWSDTWAEMAHKWEELRQKEDIPVFHMTDFVHHTERFSDARWELAEERKRVLGLFLNLIREADVIPVAAAVSIRDFNGLSEAQRARLVSPYHVAFQEVTNELAFTGAHKALRTASHAAEFFNNRISMVYAKLKKFTGPAEALWHAVKGSNHTGIWMDSYAPGEPASHPPLQAADIWAYSLGHLLEHHPPKKIEAQTAFNFFSSLCISSAYGRKPFTHFDRDTMLMRLHEMPDVDIER